MASDGGLPASRFFSKVHPGLKVPLNTLYLNLALVIIFGLIFLGSSSAFNAIVSASVVLLDLAYGIPIAINCIRGRNTLPERSFVLPNVLGWVLNIVRTQKRLFLPYGQNLTNIMLDFVGLRFPHHCPLPLPSRTACYWQQHEYVLIPFRESDYD